MRFVSAALGALTVVFVFLAAREFFLSRRLIVAVLAALLVAFEPMFAFGSGSLNNDAGVNVAAAALLYVMIRALRVGLTSGLAICFGALLVLAPLMKGTGYELYPAAALATAAILKRRHSARDVRIVALGVAAFVLVQLSWTLASGHFERGSFTTPGGAAPGTSGPVADAVQHPFGFASYIWQVFLPKLPFMTDLHPQAWPAFDIYVKRGWGAFGWYAIGFPNWVYIVIATIMVCVAILAVRSVWRIRMNLRTHLLPVLLVALVIVSVIGAVEASFYTPNGGRAVVAEQGRYAFTAIGAFAIVAAGSCFAFGRRLAPWIASGVLTLVVVLNIASVFVAYTGFYT
jgi:4-amino-4-deoxy-L-arabinose transferase-like glycosyltransferase